MSGWHYNIESLLVFIALLLCLLLIYYHVTTSELIKTVSVVDTHVSCDHFDLKFFTESQTILIVTEFIVLVPQRTVVSLINSVNYVLFDIYF